MVKILIVNNNDSFIYNLVEFLRESNKCLFDIVETQKLNNINTASYDAILLSPGANLPAYYPEMLELIEQCSLTHAILGVCLGHQALAKHFGASLKQLESPKHGHSSELSILDNKDVIFRGIDGCCSVGRYHSWVVDRGSLPPDLIVTSTDKEGNIMSFRHSSLAIIGVQFHPESIITTHGRRMVENWIDSIKIISQTK